MSSTAFAFKTEEIKTGKMEMDAVKVRGLSKVFYKREFGNGAKGLMARCFGVKKSFYALNNISFNIKKGEIFGIIGHNGSGKSTLIRILSTLMIPSEGDVRIFDHDVIKESLAVKRHINRVNVEASFFKVLTVYENILYAARLYGLSKVFLNDYLKRIIRDLDFSRRDLDTKVENLSRGMQQKVAIMRSLLNTPNLLLLDEPTTGLDPISKKSVQDTILGIRKSNDITIILTSHDMEEIDTLCDRVLIINKGEIKAIGENSNLKQQVGNLTRRKDAGLEDVFWYYTREKWLEVENDE